MSETALRETQSFGRHELDKFLLRPADRIVLLEMPACQERIAAILTRDEDIQPVIGDEVSQEIGKPLKD